MTKARCLCGDIRWELDGPLEMMSNCHCVMCRKAHGSAFATYIAGPIGGFRWTSGEDKVVRYQSSEHGNRGFCPRCGSVVASAFGDIAFMPAGCAEGDIDHALDSHIFVTSKAPWHEITDDAKQYEGYPPEYGIADTPFTQRAESSDAAVGGSCLCGKVQYEFTPPAVRMLNCHCSRCRYSRSAAHSTQVFLPADQFRWILGEDNRTTYKVPDAKFFAPTFCNDCGSLTPKVNDSGLVVIPAGTLDDDPGLRPEANIFVGSKAPWFSITDSLPQFDEMPPRK